MCFCLCVCVFRCKSVCLCVRNASEKNIENAHFAGTNCSKCSLNCSHSTLHDDQPNCRCPPVFFIVFSSFAPGGGHIHLEHVSFYNHILFVSLSPGRKSSAVVYPVSGPSLFPSMSFNGPSTDNQDTLYLVIIKKWNSLGMQKLSFWSVILLCQSWSEAGVRPHTVCMWERHLWPSKV